MRSHLVLTGVLLVVFASGCSGSHDGLERTLPTANPSHVVANEPATPSPTPAAACPALLPGKVSEFGSGFVVELNIMSGRPNPAWRLSKADGIKLRQLLVATRRGIDTDGPDQMGGYGVSADRGAIDFLRGLELPERFWVPADHRIAEFLGGTFLCNASVP